MANDSKLKLIFEATQKFFGKLDATEAEIHDHLSTSEPLEKQLADAAKGIDPTELNDLKARVASLETRISEQEAALTIKDERIAEMQTAAAAADKAAQTAAESLTALKAQHAKEINTLAGKVAALEAGNPKEQDEGGDTLQLPKDEKRDTGHYEIANDELKKYTQTRVKGLE